MANQQDLSLSLVKECAWSWHVHSHPCEDKVVFAAILTVIAYIGGAPSSCQIQSTQQNVCHNLMWTLIRLMKANDWIHLV